MRKAAAALLFAALIGSAQAETRKIEFTFRDRAELADLEASGAFELVTVNGHRATALQTMETQITGDLPPLRDLRILQADIDDELAAFRAAGNVGKYHTVETAAAELKELAAKYPDICKLESIGKTFEGRDMWVLKVSGAADTTQVPRMLIFGLTHAREWISAELPFVIIHKLLDTYATDPAMKALVDTHAFWIMPVTNPDGFAYSQASYSMWRKNRSKRDGVSQVGVDVNRNFEVGWGTGSSGSPSSDVYRGPAVNSELETQALNALFAREKFNVSLSFHSYSELILYPWGHSRNDPPGKETLAKHGKAMGNLNHYRPGSVAQILYTAGGATDDTFFAKNGAWSYTYELATRFAPSDTKIQSICEQNWPAVLHLMKATDELAATPVPSMPAFAVEERLARLEGAWRDERLAPVLPGLEPTALDTLREAIAGDVAREPHLAAEIERRAGQSETRALYLPLVR